MPSSTTAVPGSQCEHVTQSFNLGELVNLGQFLKMEDMGPSETASLP